MMIIARLRPWLLGITIGIMIALAISPDARMLMIQQVSAVFGVTDGFTGQYATENNRAASVARRHPDDPALQLAATLSLPTPHEMEERIYRNSPDLDAHLRQRWMRVDALSKQYPDSAIIAAASLRTALDGVVHHDASKKTDPRDAALFVQEAQAGGRIDPDNAYFPLMQAVGLYDLHRDTDAAAVVLYAGTLPRWNEYTADETEGRWRLAEARYGTVDAFGRTAISAAAMFPQHAALREVCRRSVAQAEREEQAGRLSHGIALRRAMMRCGALMRAQSTSAIGSLVGIAIVALGMRQPDGIPDPANFATMSREQRSKWRVDRYCAFLTRNGQAGEAHWVRAETADDDQALVTLQNGLRSPDGVYNIMTDRLLPLVVDGVIVLTNTLWVLILGICSYLLVSLRSWRSRNNASPLPPITGASLAVTGLILVATQLVEGMTVLNAAYSGAILVSGAAILLVNVPALFLLAMRRRMSVREAVQVATIGTMTAILAISALLLVYRQILAVMELSNQGGDPALTETINVWLGFEILAVPLILSIIFAIGSRMRRMRLSTGVMRGLVLAAVPVTALLVAGYAGVTLAALRVENRINQALSRQVRHEGEYLASITGTPWPGVVPEEPASTAAKAVIAAP